MSDKESWIKSFDYLADKTVNPVRACATYEQIEAQNRKNEQRYGGSPGLWAKDKLDKEVTGNGLYVKYRGETV